MKYCPKCDKNRGNAYFYLNERSSDGLSVYCKKCTIEKSMQRYREKNKEVKEYQSKYAKTHRDIKNKAWQKWWEKNKEKKREQNRNWHRLKNDM